MFSTQLQPTIMDRGPSENIMRKYRENNDIEGRVSHLFLPLLLLHFITFSFGICNRIHLTEIPLVISMPNFKEICKHLVPKLHI